MSKRNVAFSKPEEPSFLKKIKEQVGYKEGPTVDTKREEQLPVSPEDLEDALEEQPTIVVLKPGDLTAEEAALHKRVLEKEEEENPADLEAPIVFKAPKKKSVEVQEKTSTKKLKIDKDKKGKKKSKSLLSFDEDEEEDF